MNVELSGEELHILVCWGRSIEGEDPDRMTRTERELLARLATLRDELLPA